MIKIIYGWLSYISLLKLTCNLNPENSCTKPAWIWSCELRRKGCSSSLTAEGRSSGLLWKHHWRKSFPSADNVSGIGGVLCNTLNIACAYITSKRKSLFTYLFKSEQLKATRSSSMLDTEIHIRMDRINQIRTPLQSLHGGFPVSISITVHPTLHMSTPKASSGLLSFLILACKTCRRNKNSVKNL